MVVNGIAFLSTPDRNYSARTCPRGKVSVEGWIKDLFHSQEENKCFIIKIRLLLYLGAEISVFKELGPGTAKLALSICLKMKMAEYV